MRVAVLGAAGTIAPALVRDLAESAEADELLLLDRDGDRARAVGRDHAGGRADAATVDAADRQALTLALEPYDLLVNAASYRVNLAAMDACLASATAYVDLGGLYHVTREQLALHDAFAQQGLLAVLGAGSAPGRTNVMAMRGARELDEVHAVRCSSANLDDDPPPGLSTPYAIETLLDELTLAPMAVRDGVPVALEPLADGGTIAFPEPIGERGSLYTLHSEVLTLGDALGAAHIDFRLSLAPAVEAALREIAASGRPPAERPAPPSARTYSAQHVELTGTKGGAPRRVVVTALTVPHAAWGLGGGIVATASVAAATVRLYARGRLPFIGVLPPERGLDPELLFAELEPRGCRIEVHTTETSEVP